MLYCSSCGGPVTAGDRFCGKCGAPQPGANAGAPSAGPTGAGAFTAPPPIYSPPAADGMTPHTASTLCYVPWFGWIASIYVLASERFRLERDTRFHAFQGLYLFVVWLIVDRVIA